MIYQRSPVWMVRRSFATYGGGMVPVSFALAPHVGSVIDYDSDRGEPGVHIGMPSTSLTLIFAVGDPLDVAWAGRPQTRARFWAHLSGLHSRPAEIRHDGRMRGVQVDLGLSGARALLGVPAGELSGKLVEAGDIDPQLASLPERLAGAPRTRWAGLVQAALITALARHDLPGPRAEVGRSLAQLTRGHHVQAVADEVGFSRRHLTDLVRAECGLSPKQFQRIARFQRAHRLVRAGRPLAAIAVECGYADQAHLTRDWTALAGCSPRTWMHRELSFVQDSPIVSDDN
jgi:AraC-like DNA-binding protein